MTEDGRRAGRRSPVLGPRSPVLGLPSPVTMNTEVYRVDTFCPHLGMLDDRASSYAYPHGHNACYAVEPACPVRLEHQSGTCLSGRYKTCSLYHFRLRPNGGRAALPAEVINRALVVRQGPRLPLWQLAAFAALSIAALLAAWLALPALRNAAASFASLGSAAAPTPLEPTSSPQSTDTLPISAPPSSVPGHPSPSPLSAATLPLTPSPTLPLSPSPTLPLTLSPTLPLSSCSRPSSWVSYTIRQGDTLFQLSRLTGTTVSAVLQANCLQSGTLLSIGQVIYLPRQPQTVGQPTAPRPTSPPSAAQPTNTQPPPPPPTPIPPTATPLPPPTDPPPPTPRNTPTSAPTLGSDQ